MGYKQKDKNKLQHVYTNLKERNGQEWAYLIQMIISTTVGKDALEEMQQASQSTRKSEMWYLDALSKMTE